MNTDRTVQSVEITNIGQHSNPYWLSTASFAKKVVTGCTFPQLSKDDYEIWKFMEITYDPKYKFT